MKEKVVNNVRDNDIVVDTPLPFNDNVVINNNNDIITHKRSRRYSDDDVREIRRLYNVEHVSYDKISKIYDCSNIFIRNIVLRNVYKDVE